MKVLVATDGSRFSKAALEKCGRIFDEARDTEIRVLTVIEPNLLAPQPATTFPRLVGEVESSVRAAAEKTASRGNASILEQIPSIAGGLSSRVAVGIPAKVIVDEAKQWGADLIVVGSHGYGFWDRAILGSVSNAVVSKAPCSVLVVRPSEDRGGVSN